MLRYIKKRVPKTLKDYYVKQKLNLIIMKDFIYDYKRFIKHSSTLKFYTKNQYQAFIIKEYHAIEKGLALRNPRKGFGVARVSKLIDTLEQYLVKYGKDVTTDITVATLYKYFDFEKDNSEGNAVLPKVRRIIDSYKIDSSSLALGGTKIVSKDAIIEATQFDFDKFFKSRVSVRDFSTDKVDDKLIKQAIETALYTPSVCNRQAWKVYHVSSDNPVLRDQFLAVQNGNKGFGDQISSLLIVTGKLSSFFSYERNQVFVDGGMFAMSLVMALHSKGLGTCCLNTSYTADRNEEFHRVMKMDEDCVPIMFIGVGHLKDEFKVAVSQRKNLSEIVETY